MPISLARAMRDVRLLGGPFAAESFWPWHALAKVISGERLDEREAALFRQCTGRTKLPAGPCNNVTLLARRRAGKDRFLSAVAIHRAAFGDWSKHLSPGEVGTVLMVGSDKKQARILRRYCRALVSVPMIKAEVERFTDEILEFKNQASLEVVANDAGTIRGRSVLALLGTEASFWNTDPDASSSDEEVVSAAEAGAAISDLLSALASHVMPFLCHSSPAQADAYRSLLIREMRYSRNGSAYSLTTAAGTRQRTASRSALRPRAKNLFVRPRSCRRFIGALLRRLREAARTMTAGQRAAQLSGSHRSLALVDAVLEFADDPWMAGVDIFNPNELQIFEEARERRLRDLHGPLLDQVAERENTLEEVQMVIDVARGDVQHASNLPGPAFEAIAAPIEKRVNAPWILSDRKTVCTVMPDGTAEYHVGTPDEFRDGVQFPDLQAYLAARAAA